MQATVQILLATYNGEKFLRKQLESLFNQTFQDFTILIRDDNSTDNTLQIIEEYQQKYSTKINIIKDDKKNVGAAQNFNLLLEKSTADYIFFCDQDDVWINNKIENSLLEIKQLEKENLETACLVFSDMKWMDENEKILTESLWKKFKIHPKYFTLNRLLIQNIPHGCTMLINKAMRNLAFPIPQNAILHDHWIALLAATIGKWSFISEPTVLLRFHSQNATQINKSVFDILKRFYTNSTSYTAYEHYIKIRVNQAKILLEQNNNNLNEHQKNIILQFIQLGETSGIPRKKIFLQNHFFRTTFWHTFKMIAKA